MYVKRHITSKIKELEGKFPVISITGPRQSGKTTLIRHLFDNYTYYNLEDPTVRAQVKEDPKAFLLGNENIVIDEAQKIPDLFSYIQLHVDENKNAKVVLSGSENFTLSERISQSLAGRVAIFKLLPFSLKEIEGTEFFSDDVLNHIYKGMYPRLYDSEISIDDWFANYMETYIQRDVRSILNIGDLDKFVSFITALATSVGTSLNISKMASVADVSSNTASAWLGILEQSYLVVLLPAYHTNINKTLRKSPKLYFWDTGILVKLLGIATKELFEKSNYFGVVFENFVVSEILKNNINEKSNLKYYFMKDSNNYEIDLVYKTPGEPSEHNLIEIKSKKTFKDSLISNFNY